jgi:hypothetical protein
MPLKLSYSKVRTYTECAKKYDFHYNHRLREKVKSGALFFGTAVDKALEALCKNPEADAIAVFDRFWSEQDINGKMVKLAESRLIVYAKSDIDWDLLTGEDRDELAGYGAGLGCPDEALEEIYAQADSAKAQRAYKPFPENLHLFMNYANWLSMRRKGYLMIDAFKAKVAHKIKKVLHTQLETILNDGENTVIGYPDLVCIWEDDKETIIDFKTSSIEYERDSVRISAQLASYGFALGIRRAGYVVFRKQIMKNRVKVCSDCGVDGSGGRHKSCAASNAEGKRCGGVFTETIRPEVLVQIIVDDIPEQTENLVIENYNSVAKLINTGVFVRNLNACNQGYGPCAYKGLCYRNDSSDLEKVEDGKTSRN